MQAADFITETKGYKITKKNIVLFNSDTCWLSNDIEITFKF